MKRNCVFCGDRPNVRAPEHVIPRWLIRATGDERRAINAGLDIKEGRFRTFAFQALKFPACSDCNNAFATLESDAEAVLLPMLDEKPITQRGAEILLRWFDKVRIGLWLGFLSLQGNPLDIDPLYYIRRRMDAADRVLLVYRARQAPTGIQFTGPQFLSFQFAPTCFGLRINRLMFVNVSTHYLIARRLGLPYPEPLRLQQDGRLEAVLQRGRERVQLPLLRAAYSRAASELCQAMIPPEAHGDMDTMALYDTSHARRFFDRGAVASRVAIVKDGALTVYPEQATLDWIPSVAHSWQRAHRLHSETLLNLNDHLLDNVPDTGHWPVPARKSIRQILRGCKREIAMARRYFASAAYQGWLDSVQTSTGLNQGV